MQQLIKSKLSQFFLSTQGSSLTFLKDHEIQLDQHKVMAIKDAYLQTNTLKTNAKKANALKAGIIALMMMLPVAHSQAKPLDSVPEHQFMSLTFHDVRPDVAKQGDRDYYAMSTENLVQFFEWLKQSKWQAIRLQDIEDAKNKGKKLPKNALLLSFDDGALSSYSQVYPLLKQYEVPAVFAIVTSWTNGNTKAAYEAYGVNNLMNWDQMREMQKSGWVEFASHSHNLHRGILSNPQGNEQPAALTHQYFPKTQRYETQAEYERRIITDLSASKKILEKELGVPAKAIIWPYGAVNAEVQQLAKKAGLPLSFSLGRDSVNDLGLGTYQRGLIIDNPTAEEIHEQLTTALNYTHLEDFYPLRALSMNLSMFQANSKDAENEKLGQVLDQVHGLASNTLILNVTDNQTSGSAQAYFPNNSLPVAQDLMNRVSWQARTRVFNKVYAALPLYPNPQQPEMVVNLVADLVKNNKNLDGTIYQVGTGFDCALATATNMSDQCRTQLQQGLALVEKAKRVAQPYLNISNNYKHVVQFSLLNGKNAGLYATVAEILKRDNGVQIELNSLAHPQALKSVFDLAKQLDESDKSKIMISLKSKPETAQDKVTAKLKPAQWKKLQQHLLQLQTAGFQKTGIADYDFTNAQAVHQHLYTPLSLSPSPLMYRDPFIAKAKVVQPATTPNQQEMKQGLASNQLYTDQKNKASTKDPAQLNDKKSDSLGSQDFMSPQLQQQHNRFPQPTQQSERQGDIR